MQIVQGETAAVVTGAASGLGRATAYALAAAGVKVTVFDLNEDGGRTVAEDIGGQFWKVNVLDEEKASWTVSC
ncbi:MAG: SDR family NAD(P)-dependent oxidoreductase [Ilumatobacteraceae bacterium]